jgi:hypothetical protein
MELDKGISTHRVAFEHAPTNCSLWWKVEALVLQFPIRFAQVVQIHAPLSRHSPVLYQLQHRLLHIGIQRDSFRFKERNKVIHKLS